MTTPVPEILGLFGLEGMTEFDTHNLDKPLICLRVYRHSLKAWMYAFSQNRIDVCISTACICYTKHNFDLNYVLLQYLVFVHFTYGLVDIFHLPYMTFWLHIT